MLALVTCHISPPSIWYGKKWIPGTWFPGWQLAVFQKLSDATFLQTTEMHEKVWSQPLCRSYPLLFDRLAQRFFSCTPTLFGKPCNPGKQIFETYKILWYNLMLLILLSRPQHLFSGTPTLRHPFFWWFLPDLAFLFAEVESQEKNWPVQRGIRKHDKGNTRMKNCSLAMVCDTSSMWDVQVPMQRLPAQHLLQLTAEDLLQLRNDCLPAKQNIGIPQHAGNGQDKKATAQHSCVCSCILLWSQNMCRWHHLLLMRVLGRSFELLQITR